MSGPKPCANIKQREPTHPAESPWLIDTWPLTHNQDCKPHLPDRSLASAFERPEHIWLPQYDRLIFKFSIRITSSTVTTVAAVRDHSFLKLVRIDSGRVKILTTSRVTGKKTRTEGTVVAVWLILPSFHPSILPSFHPSILPSFHPSILPSFRGSRQP